MSKKQFETIMAVGDIHKAMKAMEALLGEAPVVNLSHEALDKWEKLQAEYDKFYKLSIEDRLTFAEMNKRVVIR